MKQNKKTAMIIGCIITICTFIAAVLIGWNHMVRITKGPKNEKKQYTIYGESKDHIAYVEFDIMTVGGKQYLGKDEEW